MNSIISLEVDNDKLKMYTINNKMTKQSDIANKPTKEIKESQKYSINSKK